MKINLNGKLSKKGTIIALALVAAFVLAGIVGAVVGHKSYIDKQGAEIVNAPFTEGVSLRRRADMTYVYVYEENAESVDVTKVLELSKGASMRVQKVVNESGVALPTHSVINVKENRHSFVLLQVTSDGGAHVRSYVLEIVSREEYRPDDKMPAVNVDDDPIIQ